MARDRGRGDAVLARAGFGDDARLAHAAGQQDLAHGVVDFVRAGVEQILALEINFRAAQFARQPFGKIKRGGPAAKLAQIIMQFPLKFRVVLRAEIFLLQLLQRMHQRFRHITSAVRAKVAVASGKFSAIALMVIIFTQRRGGAKRICCSGGLFGSSVRCLSQKRRYNVFALELARIILRRFQL